MIFIDIVLFVIGVGVGLFLFTMIAMPALFSFPKTLAWYTKKRVKIGAIVISLTAPVMWSILSLIVVWLFFILAPNSFDYLKQSTGFNLGVFIGFWFALTGPVLRRSSRDAISYDFFKLMEPYSLPEFEKHFREQLVSLEIKINKLKTNG